MIYQYAAQCTGSLLVLRGCTSCSCFRSIMEFFSEWRNILYFERLTLLMQICPTWSEGWGPRTFQELLHFSPSPSELLCRWHFEPQCFFSLKVEQWLLQIHLVALKDRRVIRPNLWKSHTSWRPLSILCCAQQNILDISNTWDRIDITTTSPHFFRMLSSCFLKIFQTNSFLLYFHVDGGVKQRGNGLARPGEMSYIFLVQNDK